jgi:dTDP-4-amino-4,6-dideoxygalactose transaminase
MGKRNIPFGRPIIGEEERGAVMDVLSGSILVHGPRATCFENEFCSFTDAPYAVSVSSCTAGMHLIYYSLGYGPGDEVIIPAQTHVATAHAVELTGAKAVFVDSEADTGGIDIYAIERAITQNTRAIAVVHYLGVPVDMPRVIDIAGRHDLFVVEDCALSLGARVEGKHVGLHGDAGVFSFYPVKHITTAEGGMVILRDGTLAKKLNLLKAFGVDRTHTERKVPGLYNTIELGFNYRMSEIHAAIGIEQLKKLPGFLAQRQENFEALARLLRDIRNIEVMPQPFTSYTQSSYYCLAAKLDNDLMEKRSYIMAVLGQAGIGSSVYYPHPVPRMAWYQNKYGYQPDKFPNAAHISDAVMALPVGPHLNTDDMEFIAENVDHIVKNL